MKRKYQIVESRVELFKQYAILGIFFFSLCCNGLLQPFCMHRKTVQNIMHYGHVS